MTIGYLRRCCNFEIQKYSDFDIARHPFTLSIIKLWVTKSSYIYHKSNIYFSNSSAQSHHNPIRTKKKTNIFNHRVTKKYNKKANCQIKIKWFAVAHGKLTEDNVYIQFHSNFNFSFFLFCIIKWKCFSRKMFEVWNSKDSLSEKIPEKDTSVSHRGPEGF